MSRFGFFNPESRRRSDRQGGSETNACQNCEPHRRFPLLAEILPFQSSDSRHKPVEVLQWQPALLSRQLQSFWGFIVWFVKLILLERHQFMDRTGGQSVKNPYVMIRLGRLRGAVDEFNWAAWVRIKPHSRDEEAGDRPRRRNKM